MEIAVAAIKPVEKWSTKDFLLYISAKLKEMPPYQGLLIPPAGWMGFMMRIKQFKVKAELDNLAYKSFIDNVCTKIYGKKGYILTFGSFVSQRMYIAVQYLQDTKYEPNGIKWLKLRDELYADKNLFKQMSYDELIK